MGFSARVESRLFDKPAWIVGPRFDLGFIALSPLITPLLVVCYWGLAMWRGFSFEHAGLFIYAVFTLALDAPHIFQTFSRTHLDPAEFKRHRALHLYLLPSMIVAAVAIYALGGERPLHIVFQIFGSWHILRQNIGFLHIYQRRRPGGAWLERLEGALFYLVWAYGFLYIPVWRDFSPSLDNASNLVIDQIWVSWPGPYLAVEQLIGWVALIAAGIWCGWVFWLLVRGRTINGPKVVFIVMTLSVYTLTFVWLRDKLFITAAVLIAFETAYHDIQYHGFLRHFQRRRFGVKSWVARQWLWVCFCYSLVVGCIEFGVVQRLGGDEIWYAPVLAIVMWHYYIDGKIWRSTPELKSALSRGQESQGQESQAEMPLDPSKTASWNQGTTRSF